VLKLSIEVQPQMNLCMSSHFYLKKKTRSQGEEPLRYLIKKNGVEAAVSGIRTRALMDSTTVLQPLDQWSIHNSPDYIVPTPRIDD
jgi:hypothetical protein